ncbi:hypothetical protein MA16_Dca003028 [Dendrobium catenatum]|uniref:Uncharacterized protein n=1 Tax=Dendrobium catenatum TaxID=906689 RepID=A0A2I0X9C7_9ASPA|nr:hypothetical protein MA16_Dca003028 [Dendrobium catenatum]
MEKCLKKKNEKKNNKSKKVKRLTYSVKGSTGIVFSCDTRCCAPTDERKKRGRGLI